VIERTLETRIHGRYLISLGSEPRGPVLVGFHGYGETAEEALDRLRKISGSDRWSVVSVQGLHQFYRRRTNEVVASWMTRQNRELAIADNETFIRHVFGRVSKEFSLGTIFVMAGFSQGVAMAYRAAAILEGPVGGVIACGGDVPPELTAEALKRIRTVLIGRGARDDWYTSEKMASDERRLQLAGVALGKTVFEGAHEWSAEFDEACSRFLQSILAKSTTL
jgi:predicted esterase